MSFLSAIATPCHLEGPEYIPEPDRKLLGGCTLFAVVQCFKSAVPRRLWRQVEVLVSLFPGVPQLTGQ